jgi:general secretion pathway protein A
MTTAPAEEAFVEFCYGIEMRKGLLVLTGEPGTGKTTLLHRLLQWLRKENKSASYVFHYHVNPDDLLQSIFQDFGIAQPSQSKSELLSILGTWLIRRNAEGDSPVVIVDEAQGLSVRALDELRLLLNLENNHGKMLQIVLAGQPELDEKLRRPQLMQLRQRIAVRKKLPLFSLQQCADYIGVRLAVAGKKTQDTFPAETIRAIHACSGGIPRVMNLLCENAMISAYAEGEAAVSVEMVRGVAADFDFEFSRLPGDFSSIPLRMEEPVKPDVRRFPTSINEAELLPIEFAEMNSPRAPEPPAQLTVETRLHQAPSSAVERPRARPVSVGISRTLPLLLTQVGSYFRRLAKSFLRDWKQFLKSAVPLVSGRKNSRVHAIHHPRTETSPKPN